MLRDINTGSLQMTAANKESIQKALLEYRRLLLHMMNKREMDFALDKDPSFNKTENDVFETIIYLEEALLFCDMTIEQREEAIVFMENKITEMEQSVLECRFERGSSPTALRKEASLVKKLNEQRQRLQFIKANGHFKI